MVSKFILLALVGLLAFGVSMKCGVTVFHCCIDGDIKDVMAREMIFGQQNIVSLIFPSDFHFTSEDVTKFSMKFLFFHKKNNLLLIKKMEYI